MYMQKIHIHMGNDNTLYVKSKDNVEVVNIDGTYTSHIINEICAAIRKEFVIDWMYFWKRHESYF